MKVFTNKTTKKISPGVNSKKFVILHHTANNNDNVVDYLAFNSKQVSVHYVVCRNGDIYKLADENAITWHAGVSSWKWLNNLNRHSIGIEIVSDGHSFTDEQRVATRELVNDIIARNNIPAENILRHADIAPGRKWDVWPAFYNNQFPDFISYQNSYRMKPTETTKTDLHVEALKAHMLGIRNGERAKDPATREEVAIMITRAIKILKGEA